MDELKIIHETEKKQYCKNIYEMYIVKTSKILNDCKTIALSYNRKLPISCYTNFRDALFHFRKLYCSVEETAFFNQGFAIKEHLNRSKSDALGVIYGLFSLISELLVTNGNLEKTDILFFRKWMHRLRTESLHKRLNGMMIFDDSLKLSDETAMAMLLEFSHEIIERNLQLLCAELLSKYTHK
ncbi:MAG: hypothetical protein NC320_01715 [Clostridium sp.]|nr:hypothetical protein [Clostridium sp.]